MSTPEREWAHAADREDEDPAKLRRIEVLSAGDPRDAADEPTIGGGSTVPEPVTEDDLTEAADGSLAGRLRAVGVKLSKTNTKDFDIPDTPLVLRARSFRDRKAFAKGLKTAGFIVRVTEGLFIRDEDTDELTPIPGWGPELAGLLGIDAASASELVEAVLDNPVRLETFGGDLVTWMAGRSVEDEQALGE